MVTCLGWKFQWFVGHFFTKKTIGGSVVQVMAAIHHLSHEKHPGWLDYIGDEILPSYLGILINHCKDPY